MAKHVGLKWEAREQEGLRYAVLRWSEEGKRKSRALGYVTEGDAEEERALEEARLRLAQPSKSSSDTVRVADVLLAYAVHLDQAPVQDKYRVEEAQRMRVLDTHFGNLLPEAVKASHVSRYLAARRATPTRYGRPRARVTLRQEIVTLRAAYRVARDQGLIACEPPPLEPVSRLPDDSRPPRRLTEGEVAALIRAADVRVNRYSQLEGLESLVQVCAWSGRRPVAILALEVGDCSRLTGRREDQLVYWRADKGGRQRGWAPLTEPARMAILARLEELGPDHTGPLWRAVKSTSQINPGLVNHHIHVLGGLADVADVQLYDLRRFAVTQILRQVGGQVRVAMRFTGHTQPATLMRYAYDEQGAAEAIAARVGWTPAPLRAVREEEGG